MSSCCVCLGLVFTALALIASAVSLVAPYWYTIARISNTGLLAHCLANTNTGVDAITSIFKHQKCSWFYENDFDWLRQLPSK